MQLRLYKKWVGILFSFLFITFLLCSCGRKTKNIFLFEEQALPCVNKLALPAVQGVRARRTAQGNLISWFALDLPQNSDGVTLCLCSKNFVGYNVYRLVRTNIIPKYPCNKLPIQSTTFLDNKKKPGYYLVRATFNNNSVVVEGPISQIVYTQD